MEGWDAFEGDGICIKWLHMERNHVTDPDSLRQ